MAAGLAAAERPAPAVGIVEADPGHDGGSLVGEAGEPGVVLASEVPVMPATYGENRARAAAVPRWVTPWSRLFSW